MRLLYKRIIRMFGIVLIVGVISSSFLDYTFSASTNINPNLIITINSDGKSSVNGNLFNGTLYPSSEEDSENGIGSIKGVIRISNNFRKIDVSNLAIGINDLKKSNGTSINNDVYNSFINNVSLKLEKGLLLDFNKTLLDYTKLKDVLYVKDNAQYQGYILSPNDRFSISKGDSIDLRYTLQMSPEAGNELQSLTASIPIIINLNESFIDDNDDDEKVVVINDSEIPLGKLNKVDHFQYIYGYPDNTVKPEGLITREEVATVFYRLLDSEYRSSIFTDKESFYDVRSSRWSVKYIATLSNGNIIKGYPDGSFKPGNPITRAELATIASMFDNLTLQDSIFNDVKGHWAEKYINYAAEKGWVKGYPDGSFKPDQYITRAEFVTLVNSVLDRKIQKSHILNEANIYPDLSENMWYYEDIIEATNSHLYLKDTDLNEIWLQLISPDLDL